MMIFSICIVCFSAKEVWFDFITLEARMTDYKILWSSTEI